VIKRDRQTQRSMYGQTDYALKDEQMADVEPLMDRHIERGQDREIDRLNAH
jgi:hypothetical protein